MTPSDAELKALWKAHGGSWHGPNVETYTMPESKWYGFMRAALANRDAARDADVVEAYIAGATAVHDEWLKGGDAPRGEPEFYEAARDYALAKLERKS